MAQSSASRAAWVALGANLGDPAAQLRGALDALRASAGVHLVTVSAFYRTPPLGPPGQPDYCNAVCELRTAMEPEALLELLQSIETKAGRSRDGERWGPRLLDLDLLHVEGRSSATPRLSLPHPELHRRAFVLVPLAEIAPDLVIPGLGRVAALVAAIGTSSVCAWSDR